MKEREHQDELGLAGKLAKSFVSSKLTPLFITASVLVGAMAVWLTPREEEPQILVPMIDIMIPFSGASPREVEERIVVPVEKLLWGVTDVEYLYSISQPEAALITARFKVGTEIEDAVVRIHHKLREHLPEKPEGVGAPLVRSYTIDDVPFLALSLHSEQFDDFKLRKIGKEVSRELAQISDIARIDVIGGQPRQVRILPDPVKLKRHHVSLAEFFAPLQHSNVQGQVGNTKNTDPEWLVEVGGFFESSEEVADIVVGIKNGRAVRVKQVASVIDGPAERTQHVLFVKNKGAYEQAVTLALAKRPGTNATRLSDSVLAKMEGLKSTLVPDAVSVSIVRDYGKTAEEKSNTLIEHLLIATFSVMILLAFALGLRSSLVVGAAVPVTLALTLLIYYLYGYSLNRVTLFALIFSIGILVDDAIVVVENIHRHLHQDTADKSKSLTEIIIGAVNEVGNPTILATFTVIAAILPMAFVGGLMGPYMEPIPVGASVAMVFSLFIAFTVSPWAAKIVYRKMYEREKEAPKESHHKRTFLDRLYDWFMGSLMDKAWARWSFNGFVALCFVFILWLVYAKVVRVKMLPFDNKNEFQVVVDMKEGTPLEKTLDVAKSLGKELENLPELQNYQIYAGTSAPVNFNGLVRHYFNRSASHLADIQVNLLPKHDRERQSHEIAKAIRPALVNVAASYRDDVRIKVVEIPPGPPVLSTIVAEIYGPDYEQQRTLAQSVLREFQKTDGIVDIDTSINDAQPKFLLKVDRRKVSLKQLPMNRIHQLLGTAMGGRDLGLLHDPSYPEPVPIHLRLAPQYRSDLATVMDLTLPTQDRSFVPVKSVVTTSETTSDTWRLRKNLQPVVYVLGDLAGTEESPIYAMQKLNPKLEKLSAPDGKPAKLEFTQQPSLTDKFTIKWDGEWQITYEVFRDLGIAFAIVMILMYILVVGWFQSFTVPIIIMLPIPLSLIGIIPGHWIFGAFFTATSMIGFIAGAGIIVRNSIILVDFIELGLRKGQRLHDAVLEAGEVRFRPMLLTASAVVVGGFVILFDPIFQGLAISLMAGEVAATLLSRFAVPLLYYKTVGPSRERVLAPK